MGRVTARRRAQHVTADDAVARPETLVVEEPLEIRVNGTPIAVIMRTPGSDIELAQGFLLTEGVIGRRDDVLTVRYCKGATEDGSGFSQNTYNVLDVTLAPGVQMPDVDVTRNFYTTSSCGVCGKASLDAVRLISRHCPGDDPSTVAAETLSAMPEKLRAAQKVFASTGGLHGAALFGADGSTLAVREDIGRHNAVDKVIGWALEADRIPLTGDRVAGQRACVVRTHAEGGHGRDPGAGRGIGAVVAGRRPGQPVRAHPRRVPTRRLNERLHPPRPGNPGRDVGHEIQALISSRLSILTAAPGGLMEAVAAHVVTSKRQARIRQPTRQRSRAANQPPRAVQGRGRGKPLPPRPGSSGLVEKRESAAIAIGFELGSSCSTRLTVERCKDAFSRSCCPRVRRIPLSGRVNQSCRSRIGC